MKKTLLCSLITVCLSSSAFASGFYVKGSLGEGTTDNISGVNSVYDAFNNTDDYVKKGSLSTSVDDGEDTNYGLAIGYFYDLSPKFAIGAQLGYGTLSGHGGTASYTHDDFACGINTSCSVSGAGANIDVDSSAIDLLALVKYNINKDWSVNGGVGVAYVMSDVTNSIYGSVTETFSGASYDPVTTNFSASDDYTSNSVQPELMIGTQYKLNQDISFGIEYKHIFGNDSLTVTDAVNHEDFKNSYDQINVDIVYTF